MRWLLLAATVAVAGVAMLLVLDDPEPRRPSERPHNGHGNHGTPDPEPDALPDPKADPEAFLDECERRGDRSVPELLKLLRSGKDQKISPRWLFDNGKLVGYPTLRAVYLEALRRVQPTRCAACSTRPSPSRRPTSSRWR